MDWVNLMSDTVTKPTAGMLAAMINAEVGDDVFEDDPTVNRLQQKAAVLFGKDAALFCPSGTMTNQIAIKVHTRALDEVICEQTSHIYQYETGGYAHNSRVAIQLLQGQNGKLRPEQIKPALRPDHDWLPHSALVVIENSCNKAGGSFYTLPEMQALSQVCRENELKFHLDGARIFNALTESGGTTQEVGSHFDSISVCLSKGLGAPVGSVLIGDRDFIKQARRFRKVMGGGMRQAGYLAAAGIYALDHHVERLREDHRRAKQLGQALENLAIVDRVEPVHTNIIVFHLKDDLADDLLQNLLNHRIKAVALGPATVRFVTHLDFTEEMLEHTLRVLNLF
ncbi:MAG: GntG family PLP-dependent aldolase [Saprospiraceae bacterium]